VSAPDVTVEARGVLCPVPIIRLARAAGALPEGSLVELLTDDPAAEYDVPAWCRLRGHELLSTEPLHGAAASGSAADPGSTGPEPHAPNVHPAQALCHLIRLGGTPGMPGAPAPA
jgi:tRNA 2-thiouridine synthesizing protein A